MTKLQKVLVLLGAPILLHSCAGCQNQTNQFVQDAVAHFYGNAVNVPPSSSATPVVTISIPTRGFCCPAQTVTSGQKAVTIPLRQGDSFYITAAADDPDGVKEVHLYTTGQITCAAPSLPSGIGVIQPVEGLDIAQTSQAKPGQNATTRLSVLYLIDQQQWNTCTQGTHKVIISVFASGTSFGGVTTNTPYVTFDYESDVRFGQ